MEIGKVPQDILLKNVINTIKHTRKEVLLQPQIGEDCSAIQLEENEVFVVSSDPITGADKQLGQLAVHININDIASSGAEPIGILVTILLPAGSSKEQLKHIMNQLNNTCNKINIQILGGHTEVTDAVNKPVLSITSIGKVKKDKLISSKCAKAGQDVVMTKWAGLEGTAIIASDNHDLLIKHFDKEMLQKAKDLISYLSIIKECKIASEYGVSSMHDITEGGVLGAAWEISYSAGVGIEIYLNKIPIKNETKQICDFFNINPYKLISSGCVIISCNNGNTLVDELKSNNIQAAVIGKIRKDKKRIILDQNSKVIDLKEPDTDELYKVNLNNGGENI